MILCIFALFDVKYLKKPQRLTNCYLPNCTIRLTEANQSICVDLESAKNQECEVLQDGLNITINLVLQNNTTAGQPAQTTTLTLFGYYYGFNYSETTTICIDSDNPVGASTDFFLASSSQVILNSIAYTNTFAPGLIQRISGDNSQFINTSISNVFFGQTDLCANTILSSSYLKNFNLNDIINTTLVISDYFGNGKRDNFTIFYDPKNSSSTSKIALNYDQATNNFTFCYKERGLTFYPYLDTSVSSAYLYVHYSIKQFPSSTTNNTSMIVYLQAKIVNYDFNSLAEVFQEINLVIMPDYVAIQSIMSNDPKFLGLAQQYEQMLEQYPNNTGMRLAYIYCKNNPSQFGSAYNSHKVGFSNVSQLLDENLYGENKSVKSNVDRLWSFYGGKEGCTLEFKYQMFALENDDILESYSQIGNLAHYSCFSIVKFSSTGDFSFVRSSTRCSRFQKPSTVFFDILDVRSRYSVFQYEVANFSLENLIYKIPLTVKIDSTNFTLQILNNKSQMVDMVSLYSVTEVNSAVVAEKSINVGIFCAIQLIFVSLSIALQKKVIPRLQEKIQQKKQMAAKMKTSMMDL